MARLSKVPAGVLPAVRDKAAEVIAATDGAVTHVWGYNTVPDHSNRRCVDFMVSSIADGDRVADYLIRNAKRLGVQGIIWNRRVVGFPENGPGYSGPSGTWRPYRGPSPHTDHPHVQFSAALHRPPSGAAAPSAPESTKPSGSLTDITRTDLERLLDNMDEQALQKLIGDTVYVKVNELLNDRDGKLAKMIGDVVYAKTNEVMRDLEKWLEARAIAGKEN